MKNIQLVNNPTPPNFKGVSISIDADHALSLKFYQVLKEDAESISAEVTSSIKMTEEQWMNLKEVVDGQVQESKLASQYSKKVE